MVSPEDAVSDGNSVKEEGSGKEVFRVDVLAAVEVGALGARVLDVEAREEGAVSEGSSSESDVPVAVAESSAVDLGSDFSVDLG